MSRLRPALIMRMGIDEREYSAEVVSQLKRSYSYVATTTVAEVPARGSAPQNTVRYDIKLHKPYWDACDDEAQAVWEEAMPKFLSNAFYKVTATAEAALKMSAANGEFPLRYAWSELRFGDNLVLGIAANARGGLEVGDVELVEEVRRLVCGGALGEGVVEVRVPSRESYARQWAAHEEAVRPAEAPEAEEPAGEDAGQEQVREQVPAADLREGFVAERDVWGVEYADGTVRAYDPEAGAFV